MTASETAAPSPLAVSPGWYTFGGFMMILAGMWAIGAPQFVSVAIGVFVGWAFLIGGR